MVMSGKRVSTAAAANAKDATDEWGDPLECANDHGQSTCHGPVEYRLAPSGSAIPRCERHHNDRWDQYQQSELERYADSDLPPAWFDPAAAGERWTEDEQ